MVRVVCQLLVCTAPCKPSFEGKPLQGAFADFEQMSAPTFYFAYIMIFSPRFDIPRDCKPHGNLDTIFDLQVM